MKTCLLVAPTALAVSLADAKANLRIDGAYLDTVVDIWLRGVIRFAENHTERAFMDQTWRLTQDAFPPCGPIRLRRTPLQSVIHVKYYDVNDVLQTLNASVYQVDLESQPGTVMPRPGQSWPATSKRTNAVEIQFTCGYGPDSTALPDDLRLYILAKLNEQFDPLTRPDKVTVQTSFIDSLLDPFIIY